jgi:invasion protein IalB
MKHQSLIITFAFLALLLCSVLTTEITMQQVVAQTQTSPSQSPNLLTSDDWSMFHTT